MFKASRKTWVLAATFAVSSLASASEYKPNEVIVKYKEGAVRTRIMMNDLYKSLNVNGVKRYSGLMKGFEQLTLDENVKVEDAVAELRHNDAVEYAQPNYILHSFPTTSKTIPTELNRGASDACMFPGIQFPPGCDASGGGAIPGLPGAGNGCIFPGIPFPPGCDDSGGGGETPAPPSTPGTRPELKPAPAEVSPAVADPSLSQAYGISKIGAPDAWTTHKGSKDMIVAVIDTGADYNHEDLSFNMWRNPNPTQNDIVGFDFVHNDGLPFDDNEHGTHCSGVIGAVGGNGIGISGVNQRVSIMALKFLSGEGSGTTADAIRAIDYAITHGAKVMSNSWGGTGDDQNQALKDAIDRAKAKDVLFIAAAGNDSANNDDATHASYPAAFNNDNLISVAATDSTDKLAFFSNYGKTTTHLAAPGVNVYSTVPGNKYAQLSGTSMAAPHVAGAAALVWSAHPSWNYKQVKAALMNTVDQVSSLNGKTVTGGRLNVFKAVLSN